MRLGVRAIGVVCTGAFLIVLPASGPAAPNLAGKVGQALASSVPCVPTRAEDRVCVNRPVVRLQLRDSSRAVELRRTREARALVDPGALLDVLQGGIADLYLSYQAACFVIGSGSGTSLLIRLPEGSLFSQLFGRTLCTLQKGRRLTLATHGVLEADGSITALRLDYMPGQEVRVAVRDRRAIVHFTGQKPTTVRRDQELVLLLKMPNQRPRLRAAEFTAFERSVLDQQRKYVLK